LKTFLVFEPADGGRDADSSDRVVFLREKFRWLALFFAPLWLLWHRLWLGFIGWLVAVSAIAMAAFVFGISPEASAPLLWLPTLVVAFEGTELLRRKLLRRGYRETGVRIGRDLEDAERRYFAEWSARPLTPAKSPVERKPAPPSPPAVSMPAPNGVIGLFPEPGVRR
jgi:hypothetical protein